MLCHVLLLVPVAGLGLFWVYPWPLASVIYFAAVLPSVMIGWAGWRALKTRPVMGIEAMRGKVGEAVTDLRPFGQVRYENALWTALSVEPVSRGERVRIQAVEGIRLWVVPERR